MSIQLGYSLNIHNSYMHTTDISESKHVLPVVQVAIVNVLFISNQLLYVITQDGVMFTFTPCCDAIKRRRGYSSVGK